MCIGFLRLILQFRFTLHSVENIICLVVKQASSRSTNYVRSTIYHSILVAYNLLVLISSSFDYQIVNIFWCLFIPGEL